MTPAGLDTRRLFKMVGVCLLSGIAAGCTAIAAGATTRAALATGAAAVATSAVSFWSTSPKDGVVVDAAKKSAVETGGTAP